MMVDRSQKIFREIAALEQDQQVVFAEGAVLQGGPYDVRQRVGEHLKEAFPAYGQGGSQPAGQFGVKRHGRWFFAHCCFPVSAAAAPFVTLHFR